MAEKQELYKLINDKTKVPRLTPIPQIDHLRNAQLEKNPLQKFRAQAMKFVRPRPPQPRLSDKWKSSVRRISKSFYTEELIKLARTIPVQGLLPEWEENIIKLIPKTSKKKHILFLMTNMKEVKQNYLKEMENFSINSIDNAEETNIDIKRSKDFQYRISNEDFRSSFINNRELISKKYFLSHRLIRTIANIMFYNLPKSFTNFEQYKTYKELHMPKLIEIINSDLQRCSLIVQNQCYNEIIRCMLQMNYLKNDKRLPKLLHCAESFMVQQILNSMMNSINSLLESLKNSENCIQLILQLICRNNTLEIEPSINDIFIGYHQIIDNIVNIGQDLVPLGEWLKINEQTKYIKVNLPEWFLNEAHDTLQQLLTNNFQPLVEHYNFVSVRFSTLCSSITKKKVITLIDENKDFDDYYSEINKFNIYLTEINAMVTNVYYNFGKLNQLHAIIDLKQSTSEIISLLLEKLIKDHQELNRSICMEFENLESRALTIPDDTKFLFELTDYVSYASKVLVKELEIKIKKSVNMLCSLLQIAMLSNEHIELNKTTVNWLELIKPVFSQHNIFCEAKKGELEDELQRKINLLSASIDKLLPELVIINDMDDAKRVTQYREFLAAIFKKVNEIDEQIELINFEERLFKFPETIFSKVDEIKETLNSFCSLIHIIDQWQRDNEVWMIGPFEYLDAIAIEKKTMDYFEKITEMQKLFKVKIKSDLASNKPFKFSGIVDDPDPLQQPAPLKLCWQILQDLNEFKKYVPLAICICNPALEKRHWNEMSAIAGINLLPNAGTTLKKIINLNLLKDYEKYQIISIGANKELALQKKLKSMIDEWNFINFSISIDDTSQLPVMSDIEKIDILLEEQFIKITKMLASYFIAPIESKVINFFEKLCLIRDTIEYWNCVQEECKYLSSFFYNEVVQNHLQTEVDLYNSLKIILESIQKSLSSTPTFQFITANSNILEKLKQGKYALELINLKVNDYFEQLRLSFTRLFFISDNEIMKLLFEQKVITQRKPHISKCFPNIAYLKTDDQFNILSIIGEGGEELKLENTISILLKSDSVTDWLTNLNKEVPKTIKNKINENIKTFNNEISLDWISSTPSMVIFCVWQIIWTSQIHGCFLFNNLESLKDCRNMLKTHKENVQNLLKLHLSRKDRDIITSLIVLLIHQEEVTNLLIEKKVHEDTDFDWKCQIRHYYQEEQVKVIIINTCIKYAYEYYSSSQQISVNTPLTDRCYRSLMEAYYQNYFGTIAGFSNVGKTETMKNLSRILAVPLFIFCSENRQDYNKIGNIFKGLVTMEAWVYFKNFTRIKQNILSVIAQYIFRISQSKSMNSNTINIHGTQLIFNPACYISFSLNPSLPKLTSLPDNLKLHFRTIYFTYPDFEKICQVQLFAAGFNDVKQLAISLTEFYNLCNDQMSSEKKYNLKLSNLKSVIDQASKLKFSYPDEEEQVLLFRSLNELNISQFIGNDIILFQSILGKCFPKATLPLPNNDTLLNILDKICINKQLTNHDILKLKIIQLYEIICLRKAIIVIGDSFSGKSTILNILKEALVLLQQQDNQDKNLITCEVINPGVLNIDRIYGFVDPLTGKWNDGICSNIIRCFTENENYKWKWLVFDGNIHSSWIEKLETTFECNRTLFLTSNERIMLTKEIQIFFETSNLQNASPSIISRCGIIHIDLQTLDWRPIVLVNIQNVDHFKGYENFIYELFNWSINPCLEFIYKYCTVSLTLTNMHLVMSTLSLFKMYMNDAIKGNINRNEKEKNEIAIWSQASLIMATNWILIGILDFESKEKFEEFYTTLWNNLNENYPCPSEIKQFELSLPTEGKIQDNIYVFKGAGYWKHCGEILKTNKVNEDTFFREPFIPTIDSVKLSILFNLHLKYRKPFMLYGEKCSGKTSFIEDFSTNLPESEYISNYFNFNVIIKSDIAQQSFLLKFNKIKRYKYEPSKNRYCIHLIDDFYAIPDKQNNTNSTLELIRQYMDYGFWYDLKNPEKIKILNMMFVGTLNTENKNFNNTHQRFLRHFNVVSMYPQSRDNMCNIFSKSLLIDLKKNSFSMDILNNVNSIVNATIEVYSAIIQNLTPTSSKVLYRFSLHDIRKIMKGCSLIQKESVETKTTFVRLWVHESFRVFGDRIINANDKVWLFCKIRDSVKSCFKDSFESVFDYLPKYGNELTQESFSNFFFGNLMDKELSKRKYEEISSIENLKNKLLHYIKEYNENNERQINIVMTSHAIQHLMRICRILSTRGGNLLMISSSGSGRKSLTRLAAYIQQQNLFEPIIDMNYDKFSWIKDIKSVMIKCVNLKKDYTILITDRQVRPEFIEYIDNLLIIRDISQLFSQDEQREIIKMVRLDAQKGDKNLELSMSYILTYFFNECKNRLHFVINVSPDETILRNYLCKYPKLIDQCTINWFDCWPEEAFKEISTHYMKDVNLQETVKCQVIVASKHIYDNAKQINNQYYEKTGKLFQMAPVSFIRTIKMYTDILSKKQEEIKLTKKRYFAGLDKLQSAAREISRMKNTLTKLKPQLESSARQVEIIMKEIENENICVERATALVKRDEEIASKKAEIASSLKSECEAEFAVTIPTLEDSLQTLNTLKSTDIALVKSMKNPPDSVKLVLGALCVMFNISSEKVVDPVTGKKSMDFLGPSKRLLGDTSFLQKLKDYDKDNIPSTAMVTIKKTYLSDKNFMPHIVAKVSIVAEALCKWVRAMVFYDDVARILAPKREKLATAQREYDETEAFLNAKRKTLADLNMKLEILKTTLETTLLKKTELGREIENYVKKLKKVEGLIVSLGSEKIAWVDYTKKLGKLFDNLAGDVLLSSAMISYLSLFDLTNREKIILEWKELLKNFNIPFSQDYDFISFLGKETKIDTWCSFGLQNNRFFLQNAIIMENSSLWCLFIDPQMVANEWIKNLEKSNNLNVLKITDENYMNKICKNIEMGIPVLLENLEEEFDISLDIILSRDIYKVSDTWYINLGQNSIVYNPNFRLYLTTIHRKPFYSVNIFNKVTVIDFLLPDDILQDRFLDILISKEKSDLQEKFEKTLSENINNKKMLKQQEESVLDTLLSCDINIIEDDEIIKILNSSKNITFDLQKRQEIVKSTKEEIDSYRDNYRHFTKYCLDLYSTLDILPNLNYMYQFSLLWFTQLYIKSIETCNKSIVQKKRIDYLKSSLLQNLHQSVHAALFENHKLIYSFILCVKSLLDKEQITEQEFNVFISINKNTSTIHDNENIPSNPASSWLSDISWRDINKISNSLAVFQNFANSFSINNTKWRKYCNLAENDDCPIPSPWDNKLTPFQKLILIRILNPDKIIFKVTEFVESVIGQSSSSLIPCNISRPYAESTCLTPIIFILPSYFSPFAIVNKFSKVLGYSTKLHSLSIGPSQEKKAEVLIEIARKNEEWIFLHNCHLDLPLIMKLEKMYENFDISNTSLGFRLWMSTQTNKKFPLGILRNSIKIVFDSPYEIKQTLTWAYKSELVKDKEFFEGCPGKDKAFSKLLYAFCLFHAVIRERKYFGYQSWNFEYDFDESDLQISLIQLKNWINQYDRVPFKALIYLLSECNYGGKIIDSQDKIYLDNLILDYCNYKVISDVNYDFDAGHAYKVPQRIEYKDHLKHIRTSIPTHTSPEDFCLDKNVALIKNNNKVKDFLYSLSCLNKTVIINRTESKTEQVQSIILKILEMMPENFNINEVQKKYKITELELLNCVLIEEIKLYNKCLNIIRDSLHKLKKAYNGYSFWTEELEEISEDIFLDLVPKLWKTHVSLCTKKLLSKFIIDLLERNKFMSNWINNGHPRFYWFGGMMSCKKLLSTIKITFAREKQVPIDQVGFEFNVLDITNPVDDISASKNSIYVYGLYLLGAKWNEQSRTLIDSKSKVLFNEMPIISFELTVKKSLNLVNNYKCPLYISPNLHNSYCNSENLLDNYILSVNLKSNINPKIWIKRGTALYCQTE